MEFSQKLKELRNKKHMTTDALAKALNIENSTLSKWENGLILPSDEELQLVGDFFGVTVQELMPDREEAQKYLPRRWALYRQYLAVIILAGIMSVVLLVMALFFVPALKDSLLSVGLGAICMVLGAYNLKGDISIIPKTLHRRVQPEDEFRYCRILGTGATVLGMSILVSLALIALGVEMAGGIVSLAGTGIALVLVLFAQYRYNKELL